MGIFRVLPRSLSIPLLRLLASAAYVLDRKHRHIAHVNLCIAFPEFSAKQRSRIARRSFENIGLNLLEVSRLDLLRSDNIGDLVSYDPDFGLENFLAARASGKPILYLTGHFSAWELLPAAHALHGYPLSFVTRPLDNAALDAYLTRIREASGNRVIRKKNSARQILQRLKEGGYVGILLDQNTVTQEGIFSDFFSIPAATSTSLALLALRTDALVLPGFLTCMQNGTYRIKFLPAIRPVRTGDMVRDVAAHTRRFNSVLEEIIRQQPEAWLWGHKRWKNQPLENPQDLYGLSEEGLRAFLLRQRSARE